MSTNKRSTDWLVLAGLGMLILFFLGRAVWPGQVLLPLDIVTQSWPPWQQPNQPVQVHNPLISDVVNYIYPVKQFTAVSLRQGIFPLWNPYVLTGYPATYNTQAGIFYPLTWLYVFLPAETAVDATIFLQLGLGAVFMYAYLRQLRLHPLAAMAGSIIFLFNGMMVVWLEWQVVHTAVIWLPLQLFFIEKLAHTRAPHYTILTAIAFALPWLGGHWNWTLYISLTTAVYLLLRLLPSPFSLRSSLFSPRSSLLTLPLGICLSTVQLLPAVLYLSQSHRQDLPFSESLQFGLLNRGVALLVPNFFGNPTAHNWWGFDNYNETTLYLGILPLLLAGLAWRMRRDWHTIFFTVWGGIGLLWTLGTPLYGLLYVLPVFGGLLPSRAGVLVVFAGAVLTALALDSLIKMEREDSPQRTQRAQREEKSLGFFALKPHNSPMKPSHGWQWLVGLFLLITAVYSLYYRADVARTWGYLRPYLTLFLLWLAGSAVILWSYHKGWLKGGLLGGVAVLWITADLFTFGYGYNTISPTSQLYPATQTADFLQADPDLFRIVTPPEGVAFPPNSTLTLPIANLSGYEPGILRRLVNYINTAEGGDAVRFERKLQPLWAIDSPLLSVLNVKYLVTIEERWGETTAVWQPPAVVEWVNLPAETAFAMPTGGLHRVTLPLQAVTGPIAARILSADGGYEFAHADGTLTDSDSYQFDFSPFPAEWGQAFRLKVEGNGQIGLTADGELAFVPSYLARPNLVLQDGKTRVYQNPTYLPRAFAVHKAIFVEGEEEALTAVTQQAAQLNQLVILELEGNPTPPALPTDQPQQPSTVTITHYGLNQVVVQVGMAQAGFVVLADSYYLGWQATLDNQSIPIYRANSLLRAVYVPAGTHEIQFQFRPLDFYLGAAVSGLALAGCVFYLVRSAFKLSVISKQSSVPTH